MITINAKTLQTAIAAAGRAVPSRPTHPVLGNLLLTADAATDKISLTGFNLELGIVAKADAEVTQPVSLAVPAKTLADIVSKVDGSIVLSVTDETGLVIRTRTGEYKIQGMDAEEFTSLPVVAAEPIAIPTSLLLAVESVLFSASTNETKQILCGVHVSPSEGAIELAATDGHRLTVCRHPIDEDSEISIEPVTIPRSALAEIDRMLATAGETINLYAERGMVAFEWGDYYVVTRTFEGQYPAYSNLIPRQFDRMITTDRKALLGALDRISVIADQKSNHIVKWAIDPEAESLTISADAQDAGSGREEITNAQFSGEKLDLAFNVKYLMELLKNLTTTEVQIQLNTPTSPVLITPLGGPKVTGLVMPVQVRS